MSTRQALLPSCALVVLALLCTSVVRGDDMDRMQGTWRVTYGEVGGRVATAKQLKGYHVTVEGNRFTLVEGDTQESVHFALKPTARPRVIEFWEGKKRGKTKYHGIYQVDGNTIKLCWGPAGKARPGVFNTKAANDRRYYILTKQ